MIHFRQLTADKKREIYVGFLAGEPKLRIARRLNIDNATVHYHINKIKYMPKVQIYALIAPKCANGHTAFKCLVCGVLADNIKSVEFQEIIRLQKRVDFLERELNSRHAPHPQTSGGTLPPFASAGGGLPLIRTVR
jgi:hypothetical protein